MLARGGLVVEPIGADPLLGSVSRTEPVSVRATRVQLSPVRAAWRALDGGAERDIGWLLLHLLGESRTGIDGAWAADAPGAARVARPGGSIEIVSPAASDRILLEFPLTALSAMSATMLRTPGAVRDRLGPSAVSSSLVAYVVATLARPVRRQSSAAFAAERGLLALIEAVLAEGHRAVSAPIADVDVHVYTRALAIIDESYADAELDSETIAVRLGVSRRRLQRILAENDTTITDVLRNRRLDAVAERLLESREIGLADLVQSVGFGAVDSARRAFVARFGMTMRDYRRERRAP